MKIENEIIGKERAKYNFSPDVSITPIVVTDYFTIKFSKRVSAEIIILDMGRNTVLSCKYDLVDVIMKDLSDLTPGIYYIKIRYNEFFYTQQILKK